MAHKRVFYTGHPQHFMRLGVTLQPGENEVDEAALDVLLANPDVQNDLAVLGPAEPDPAAAETTTSAAPAAEEA